jgi:hypothetical protein
MPTSIKYEIIIWAPAPAPFDTKYRISNTGLVQKRTADGWKDVKPRRTKAGRLYIQVRQHFFVHRWVLEAFVGPCPEGMEARHFPDRDPTNNNLGNLSWVTHIQNGHDMVIHGTLPRGSRVGNARLAEADIIEIHKLLAGGASDAAVARQYNVDRTTIRKIRTRQRWNHVEYPEYDHKPRTGPSIKLTEADVIEIRKLLTAGHAIAAIASKYGISNTTIRSIKLRKTWRHVADC